LKIPYYLSGGTLLGVIREGDFIKWDWDIGIDTKIEDIYPKRDKLISVLRTTGFQIQTYYSHKQNFKINAVKHGARYEVAGFIKIGNNRCRKAYYYPKSFLEGHSEVILRGEKYRTFPEPKEYLTWLYGDWKTPIRTINKRAYVTNSSRMNSMSRIYIKIVSFFN
jgi:hypothetical protein